MFEVFNVATACGTIYFRTTEVEPGRATTVGTAMNPNDPLIQARLQMLGAMAQMHNVAHWLQANGENLNEKTLLIVGATMMTTVQYTATAISIINKPDVERPIMGRRCLFY